VRIWPINGVSVSRITNKKVLINSISWTYFVIDHTITTFYLLANFGSVTAKIYSLNRLILYPCDSAVPIKSEIWLGLV